MDASARQTSGRANVGGAVASSAFLPPDSRGGGAGTNLFSRSGFGETDSSTPTVV